MKKRMLSKGLGKVATVISTSVAAVTISVLPVYAQIDAGIQATHGPGDATPTDLPGVIQKIIQVLLYVIGVAAVLMLIIGGIRYVVSAGDQAAVTGAKNTILYALIGLVIAFIAYAAVNYIFSTISTASAAL